MMKIMIKHQQIRYRKDLPGRITIAGRITLFCLALIPALLFSGCDVEDEIGKPKYAVTVSSDQNGFGWADFEDEFGYEAPVGLQITLRASPLDNYSFKQWEVISGGVSLLTNSNANPATFIMPSRAVEIRAEFELSN